MRDSLLFYTERRSGQGAQEQDGGALGSRRGYFNNVQYGIFLNGHTGRGNAHVKDSICFGEVPAVGTLVSSVRPGGARCVYRR